MENKIFITKQILRKAGIMRNSSEVYRRQMELNGIYGQNPTAAMITDYAEVIGENLHDPFRTVVHMNNELQTPFHVGVHRAVGGDHDFPNPGDMLCATLAACLESTLRMIAHRYNITLTRTKVQVSATVDVRGTLRIDLKTPVEFQSMHITLDLEAKELTKKMLNTLIMGTKKSCIIYQTLRKAVPITIEYPNDEPE